MVSDFKIKLGIVVSVVFLVCVAVIFSMPKLPENSINIDNLAEYDKKIPVNKRNLVLQNLFSMVKSNLKENEKVPKNGAKIREKTFKTKYDKKEGYTMTSFIVDIPALRQSYFVQYRWSGNEKRMKTQEEYPELVSCLSRPKDAIYKEFICKNDLNSIDYSQASPYDVLMNYLPYNVFADSEKSEDDPDNTVVYNALYRVDKNKKPYIKLVMNVCDKEELVKKYTADFYDWVRFRGVDSKKLDIRVEKVCI